MTFIKALRIDDIGASTKIHEQYSKKTWQNFGILKHRRVFGAWGPYREMLADEWLEIFRILEQHRAKLTVAITAAWVEKDGSLTPFPIKFPDESRVLKRGMDSGLLEIACHGLTHCVLENNAYLPRLTRSNRKYHREFWDWLPIDLHYRHIQQALSILENAFNRKILVLVPPGNVFCAETVDACRHLGIKTINCNKPIIFDRNHDIHIISNDNVLDFHDREIVLHGTSWLKCQLEQLPKNTEYRFVSEL